MQTITWQQQRYAPSKVVCIGRNYLAHIAELNNPIPEQAVFFIKPNSAVSEALLITSKDVISYEAELCFLIQQSCLVGVGIGLDLTQRELQSQLKAKGLPWERCKAFDGAAVLSPFVPFDGQQDRLSLRLYLDGTLVQQGGVTEMMYAPDAILQEAQSFLSFEDNDVLMTGTPKGVGRVEVGACFIGQVWQGDTLLLEQSWTAQLRD